MRDSESEMKRGGTHLRASSLRLSTVRGCRLSARVFFLISLPVSRFPLLVSAWKAHSPLVTSPSSPPRHTQSYNHHHCRPTFARKPPKLAPMPDRTFFFLASSSAFFLASSSSFLWRSSYGAKFVRMFANVRPQVKRFWHF